MSPEETESPKISVIISTYNAEEWLKKVLWGFNCQIFKDFEVVVADDGSGPKTKQLLEELSEKVFYKIVHVWQEDDGFQKSRILNKAVEACSADYIIMTDGDCIPREDFVEVHYINKEPGYFISGGYYMLPMNISKMITLEDIEEQNCFDINWLKAKGIPKTFKNNKLTASGMISKLLNTITPTNASWNGHNSSGWKKDILNVNGFDERMQYGGQDRELGERLFNFGIKSKQLRYSAVCVHLDHKRGYKTPESIAKNQAIRKETRSQKLVWTHYGITK
ncbi:MULTISPECIES: glycosyltransferase family 2 protein [Flavobacteriaceae]|jgi:glycosyltransferase involved in cell wall biosynthesis|uniref:Glycosyltransferase family 2 protein n=1 Tax=Flagellimonas sp. MMG031 TaxID=3158549 RepID=A0AAU7MXD2_9FLAO|nr:MULTISPECIES: glycosyltransferase family 2 protein [unclassified Allomuricauda]MBO6871985.1 glycosyltransferase family 2 protein [Balneola sp.]MBO6534063.1 glycosyltransferase family 2 protein [Allomuricauda sp.]MBO6588763.1 glycosyltransferase family 2 protein [Allomuricauda sp.]MBO6618098.1 glycosyltransferase family 2 protein [Allomuricauda sp.]MBO6644301.1 glycosyltransferase family 2 protein [Allomuricauda sp.]